MAGYTSAIPLTSLTIKHVCLICKWIKTVFR
jgi:hypothetical protein